MNYTDKSSKLLQQLSYHLYAFLKPHCANKIILDVGCGDGSGTALLASFGAKKVIGVDLDVVKINHANAFYKQENIEFQIGNCEQISNLFTNETFDLIVVNQTLEHVLEKKQFLTQLKQLLGQGKTLVISCLNYKNLPTQIFNLQDYSSDQLIKDTTKIFGENIQIFYSNPCYGIAQHTKPEVMPMLNSNLSLANNFKDEQFLACTVIYDESIQIKPSAYLELVSLDAWSTLINHDIVSELKTKRLIFELQQRALLAQAVILENQMLEQRLLELQQEVLLAQAVIPQNQMLEQRLLELQQKLDNKKEIFITKYMKKIIYRLKHGKQLFKRNFKL